MSRFDRRDVLRSIAGVCAAGAVPPAAALFAAPAPAEAASTGPRRNRFHRLLDDFMTENLRAAPELATALGLDTGPLAGLRGRLDDRSIEGQAAVRSRVASQLRRLAAFDGSRLTRADRVHLQATRAVLELRDDMGRRFRFGEAGLGNPYVVSQMTGAYTSVPDFLDSKHPLESSADVDAYVARVRAFAEALDQETARIRGDARAGVIPPDFILQRTIEQLTQLRDAPRDQSTVMTALERRGAGIPSAAGSLGEVRRIYDRGVRPALGRQLDQLVSLKASATHDAGVWRLPDGEAYYAACLRASTSSDRLPEDVHATGLELVQELTAQIDSALRKLGLTQGTAAERVRAIYSDAKFHYPNTEEGRRQLMADVRRRLDRVSAKLHEVFRRTPGVIAEVRPVPAYLEKGSPAAYYQDPSIDGSRPGVFYINLRDTGEIPTWYLPTVAFHEVNPGHHLQQAIAQEGDLPLLRKIMWSQAYGEGWALYAEQLADELGMYESDPWGRVGYLWAALLRACRLVVDTGLHAKRWSREQAIEWMAAHSGAAASMVATEVERYCIQPGQACSYMIGKLAWTALRDRARASLGARFDLRDFHDAGLSFGTVPLTVLETLIDDYIDRQASPAAADKGGRQ